MDLFYRMNRRSFIKSAGKVIGVSLTLPAISGLGRVFAFENRDNPEYYDFASEAIRQALEKGMDYCDFFYENVVDRSITMENGVVSDIDYGADSGIGIRTRKNDSVGYAYSQSLRKDDIFSTVNRACQIAELKPKKKEPVELKVLPDRGVIPVKTDLADLGLEKRIEQMQKAHEEAKKVSDLIQYIKVDYIESLRRIIVANSNGVIASDYQPRVFFIVHCLGIKEGKRHMGRKRISYTSGYEMFEDGFPAEAGKAAAMEVLNMIDAVDAPAGAIPVVIANGWGGVIVHEAVGHGLEGDAVVGGSSFYKGMTGRQVASEHVFMADSGNIKRFRGSYNYDDEGSPSKENILIAEGNLIRYITDIDSSAKLKMENSGNARRQSFRFPPMVRMSNTFLMPGKTPAKDIIEDTKYALYAVEFGGGSVDIVTGNYTFTVREGYLIEDGRITKPVKGATLIGRGPDSLKKVDAVASDLDFAPGICGKGGQWVPVNVGQPTIRVSEMTVGGISS